MNSQPSRENQKSSDESKIQTILRAEELQLVDWITRQARRHPSVPLGIGDDMATIRPTDTETLLSSDMLLDGVHFDTSRQNLRDIGRKAVACSLSDCAAMAVRPTALVVSLALPTAMLMDDAKTLYDGMDALASEYDAPIVGGDTTRWANPLAINVTVHARPHPGIEPVTRRGAAPGDNLYVTGPLGGSLLGRHLIFTPRVQEARDLAMALGNRLHAMMDISDGLALDLWRMCSSSGVGAMLDECLLMATISPDARRASELDGRSAMEHALTDGEDFELLLAVEGHVSLSSTPVLPVGEITRSDLTLRNAGGDVNPLEPKGFLH